MTSLSMCEVRPSHVASTLHNYYDEHASLPREDRGYKYHGSAAHYGSSWTSPAVTTQSLIEGLEREHGGQPLRILDVGTAGGTFLTGKQPHEAWGITAQDYRGEEGAPQLTPEEDERYIVGDAHFLLDALAKYGAPRQYDLVVSSMTLRWLKDPFATLETMCNLVTPGGVLFLADLFNYGEFFPQSTAPHFEEIIARIEAAGFRTEVLYPFPRPKDGGMLMPGIVAYRNDDTTAPVRFGIAYNNDPASQHVYAPLEPTYSGQDGRP